MKKSKVLVPVRNPDGSVNLEAIPDMVTAKMYRLIDDVQLYFELHGNYEMINLTDLVNSRLRTNGVLSANKLMSEAAKGTLTKRKPICVKKAEQGTFIVVDGNSTVVNARVSGWKAVPCHVLES